MYDIIFVHTNMKPNPEEGPVVLLLLGVYTTSV